MGVRPIEALLEDVIAVFSSSEVASPDRLPLSRTTPVLPASARASADYAFSFENDVFLNGRKADVLCEKVEGSGPLGANGSADVTLVVDRRTGEYELNVGLRTPEKQQRGTWSIGVTTLPGRK